MVSPAVWPPRNGITTRIVIQRHARQTDLGW